MSEQFNYSDQIQKMNPSAGELLIVTAPSPLTLEQRQKVADNLAPLADRLGVQLLVLGGGFTAQLQPGVSALLSEQKKQTAILERMAEQQLLLIQALAAEQDDQGPDAIPTTFLDGKPVSGPP